MEALNMSKLNLSSVDDEDSSAEGSVTETEVVPEQSIMLIDEENHCDYNEEIWQTLLEQDAKKMPIHFQSPQLEFRGTLVQQLRDATKKLGLSIATLHAAVAQLDLFMDAHRLRADRLTHVAMACLSLAAKSEEKYSRAPTLKALSKTSGTRLCGDTFRQLEWMVGQHVRWRLLAPTPVSFAALLAEYVVTESDLSTRHPKFVRRFKRDGAKMLERYLDLTLSDVRLKVMENVDIGCACVACTRAELGLDAWPSWLAERVGRSTKDVTGIAKLLHRMMQKVKSQEKDTEDQGYGSARTSPSLTPCTSPQDTPNNVRTEFTVLDKDTDTLPTTNFDIKLPQIESTCQRINNVLEYKFSRSRKLIDASLSGVPPQMAVKRGLGDDVVVERKRYRIGNPYMAVV